MWLNHDLISVFYLTLKVLAKIWSLVLRCGYSLLLGDGLNAETKCHCTLHM